MLDLRYYATQQGSIDLANKGFTGTKTDRARHFLEKSSVPRNIFMRGIPSIPYSKTFPYKAWESEKVKEIPPHPMKCYKQSQYNDGCKNSVASIERGYPFRKMHCIFAYWEYPKPFINKSINPKSRTLFHVKVTVHLLISHI